MIASHFFSRPPVGALARLPVSTLGTGPPWHLKWPRAVWLRRSVALARRHGSYDRVATFAEIDVLYG